MKLKKISYDDLKSPQQEVFNFQQVAARLAEYGFNCIKLADDWLGADFLAYDRGGKNTLQVQLKSRISIDNGRYKGKSLYIAFPVWTDRKHLNRDWYLIRHATVVALAKKHAKTWFTSVSWTEHHGYSSGKPNKELLAALERFRL